MWTRRLFLKSSGFALLSFGFGPSFLVRAAQGANAWSRKRVLVALFQRGAMDGLAAVPPVDSPDLVRLRPRLALGAARASGEDRLLDLGVGFGFHPALAPLLPLFQQRQLAVVHCVGSPDPTRSHFDAQDYMEMGTPGRKGTSSGWLNRVCGELGHEASPLRALSLTAALPRSLYGPQPAVAVARLEDLALQTPPSGSSGMATVQRNGFEALYEQTTSELLRRGAGEAFEAARLLQAVTRENRVGRGRYPASPLGEALRQIAAVIRADVGLEVAFAESGGWDTHVRQGAADGTFARRAEDLAQAVAAFWEDLGARQEDVVLLTMTEFGRTVAENGSGGTDHGHGSCLFVLGSRVDGGKVHGKFPGLDRDVLFEGRDLPVTTDFRSVFSEVAVAHLGVDPKAELFPGWTGGRLPLFRSA